MKRNTMIPALMVAAGLATAGAAFAKSAGTENDAVADLAKAKITLNQAVGAAEAQAGGKATQAELDSEGGTTVFKVEVVTAANKVMDVKVDANDGKVLSSQPDPGDHGKAGADHEGGEDND